MKSMSGKAFAKILERHGWNLIRISGSHCIYSKPGKVFVYQCRSMAMTP